MTRLLLVLLDLKDYYLSTQRRECRAHVHMAPDPAGKGH